MNEKTMIKEIYDIGQIIDKLDSYSINIELEVKDIDISLIIEIENWFANHNVEQMSNDEKIVLYYTHANYQAVLKSLTIRDFKCLKKHSSYLKRHKTLDDFVFKNYSERINEYRKAIKLIESGTKVIMLYTSQVYVNLANLYMEMGRVVESVQILINANKIVKGFPMAKGNLAIKHYSLATRTTDKSIMRFLMEKGLAEIRETIDNATEDLIPLDNLNLFCDWELYIERAMYNNLSDVKAWNESKDIDDKYKNWCAKKQLSLNYINIIYKVGNIDDIHMPNMGLGYFSKKNNMEYYAWFNTIKQEYNIARYFMYQIDEMDSFANGHESQKFNVLINTLDYPAIGYKTEVLKNSLKVAFSVLDKIGLLCSHFHNQDIEVHKVDFHKWYKEIKMEVALRSSFNSLYWLSQDLDTNKGAMRDVRLLRNALEHRFIRVLEHYSIPISEELSTRGKHEYIVDYGELEKKSYEALRLVRNAIFYMASGFNMEFNKFYYDKDRKHPFIPLILDIYEDDWKN